MKKIKLSINSQISDKLSTLFFSTSHNLRS